MARPTKIKCTDKELKDYIFNFLIDDKGKRRSIRELIISEAFIKFTGLTPSPNNTLGTITYHMKRLKINEKTKRVIFYQKERGNNSTYLL